MNDRWCNCSLRVRFHCDVQWSMSMCYVLDANRDCSGYFFRWSSNMNKSIVVVQSGQLVHQQLYSKNVMGSANNSNKPKFIN